MRYVFAHCFYASLIITELANRVHSHGKYKCYVREYSNNSNNSHMDLLLMPPIQQNVSTVVIITMWIELCARCFFLFCFTGVQCTMYCISHWIRWRWLMRWVFYASSTTTIHSIPGIKKYSLIVTLTRMRTTICDPHYSPNVWH